MAADDVLETRIVAGLNEGELNFPLPIRRSARFPPDPAAELALQAGLRGEAPH